MDMLLKVLGGSLGVVFPAVFIFAIRKGISNSPFDDAKKSSYANVFTGMTALWVLATWAASVLGLFSYKPGDTIPRLLIPMFVPALIGWGMIASKDFRTVLDHTPLSVLAGVQTARLMGGALLLVVYLGILPKDFAQGAYGDIVTGALALVSSVLLSKGSGAGKVAFWAFTVAGMCDLLNVLRLLLVCYPIWNNAVPSSAPAGDFALVMLPALAAPVALMLHAYAVRNALVGVSK